MIACNHCGHPDDAHPIRGGGYGPASAKMTSPCTRCDCLGFVSPKRASLPLEPTRADNAFVSGMSPQMMYEVLELEHCGDLGGEATFYYNFTIHPAYGFEGKFLMRGIKGHEVPGHMRSMMELSDRGDVVFRLRHIP